VHYCSYIIYECSRSNEITRLSTAFRSVKIILSSLLIICHHSSHLAVEISDYFSVAPQPKLGVGFLVEVSRSHAIRDTHTHTHTHTAGVF